MKKAGNGKTEDKIAIVLKSLIMILCSRGFIDQITRDTLIDFLKGEKDKLS